MIFQRKKDIGFTEEEKTVFRELFGDKVLEAIYAGEDGDNERVTFG